MKIDRTTEQKTAYLISALALDAARPVLPVSRLLTIASFAGAAASSLLFALLLQPRPDIAVALYSPGFCLKVLVAGCIWLTAAAMLDALARPTAPRLSVRNLALGPVLLVAGIVIELTVLPSSTWLDNLVGRNAPHCLALIPLLSL